MDSSQTVKIFGESNATNKWQKEAQDAERAATKLRELRSANINLEAVVSSSSDAYKVWIQQLRDSGENQGMKPLMLLTSSGNSLSFTTNPCSGLAPPEFKSLTALRKSLRLAGMLLCKLDVLLALQGLGFLKVDAMQAAAEYTTTLGNMADDVQQAIAVSGEDVAKASNAVDGSINTSSQLGVALVGVFGKVSPFLTSANSGANIDDLMGRLRSQLGHHCPTLGKQAVNCKRCSRIVSYCP